MREKRGPRAARSGPSRASSSRIPLPLRYRAAGIQRLREAMRHGRRRETPRTRLARGPQPPSGSPVPGRLARRDTEFGIARDQASPKLRAWFRFACNVAGAARMAPKQRLRGSRRSRRPPPSASRRRDPRLASVLSTSSGTRPGVFAIASEPALRSARRALARSARRGSKKDPKARAMTVSVTIMRGSRGAGPQTDLCAMSAQAIQSARPHARPPRRRRTDKVTYSNIFYVALTRALAGDVDV